MDTGAWVLRRSGLNKGLAFSSEERRTLRLSGLLPATTETQARQLERVQRQLAGLQDDLHRYLWLRDLRDRNERLFFQLCQTQPEQLLPLIYTPTIGAACIRYSQTWTTPRGLFITLEDLGHIDSLFDNLGWDAVKTIVVTDGERILGLGDLGANGMGIPTGKCDVITAFGGVRPDWVLPVTLDVGTNNQTLLNDPLYVGRRVRRDNSAAYDQLVDEFVHTVVKRFGPTTLIQFEDFGNHNAFRFLQQYRTQFSVYDDDIQGTAAVVVAGLMATVDFTQRPLHEQTFLFFGAGMASVGCAELLVLAMRRSGLTDAQARGRIWMMDSKGLLVKSRPVAEISKEKLAFVQEGPELHDLADTVRHTKATVLIGASAQPRSFTEAVCRAMAANAPRPIILALSNPTDKAECTAAEAYTWTDCKALFASGSPFPYFTGSDGVVHAPGQANNCYIFPAVALAAVTYGFSHIIDEMFLAAADALAAYTRKACAGLQLQGMLYPPLSTILEATTVIAAQVAEVGFAHHLATVPRPVGDLVQHLASVRYHPAYDASGLPSA